MKKIKTYKVFNESLKDKLKGKSDDDIIDKIEHLSPLEQFNKATYYGLLSLIKKLLKGEDSNIFNWNMALGSATEQGHLELVKFFMGLDRVNPSDWDNFAIRSAAGNGYLDIIKELLKDDRVDPSSKNNQSIIFASQQGHLEVVKELMKDKRVDPSDTGNEAIRLAIRFGRINVIKELLKDNRVTSKIDHRILYTNTNSDEIYDLIYPYYSDNRNDKLDESLRDKLKGISDEEFNKEFNKLSPQDQFNKAIEFNMIDKVKELYFDKKNVDPLWDGGHNINVALANDYDDIMIFYMDHPEGWASNEHFIKGIFNHILSNAKVWDKPNIIDYAKKRLDELGIPLTESLKDKLKGKPDEDISKSLDDLDIFERIRKIQRHNLDDKFMPSDEEILKELNSLHVYDRTFMIKDFDLDDKFMPSEEDIKKEIDKVTIELTYKLFYDSYIVTREEAEKYWKDRYEEIKYLVVDNSFNTHDVYGQYIEDLSHDFVEDESGYDGEQLEREPWENEPIKESLKDKLKGKSEDEILNVIKNKKISSPKYRFEKACEFGILSIIEEMLKDKHFDPSYAMNLPIKIAANYGQIDVVKKLMMDKRVDPSDDNNYFVHDAAAHGHADVVEELLKDKRVDPSVRYNTCIGFASQLGHIDVVKVLLKDKRVDPTDSENYAIRKAIENNHIDILKVLLNDDRVKMVDVSYAKSYALKEKNVSAYILLSKYKKEDKKHKPSILKKFKNMFEMNESLRDKIKGKSEEDIYNKIKHLPLLTQFYKSCEYGYTNRVKQLIEDGFVLPKWDEFAIEISSKNGHVEIVKELINIGVDPSCADNSPIRYASDNGHLDVVKELLKDERVDPSDYDNSAIIWASYGGYLDIVKLLLNDKQFNNFTIESYKKAIGYATDGGYKNIIELLKKHKPSRLKRFKRMFEMNESLRDKMKGPSQEKVLKSLLKSKLSPIDLLYKSVQYNIKDGVILALQRGVTNDYYTEQALMWAVNNEHIDIIQMLIDSGVDIKTNYNRALRTAAYDGYYDVAKLLLENGANVHDDGDGAIKWAATNGHHRIVKLLLDYHANPTMGLNGAIKYNHHNIVSLLKKYIELRKIRYNDN